jgi:hypothetical protein
MDGVTAGGRDRPAGSGGPARNGEDLANVLASIRQLVSAETAARVEARERGSAVSVEGEGVLVLTPAMRIDDDARGARSGEILAEGIAEDVDYHGAPILDEEALRRVVNGIVREELQGELGDRISRNLRKLIRREIGQVLAEQRQD